MKKNSIFLISFIMFLNILLVGFIFSGVIDPKISAPIIPTPTPTVLVIFDTPTLTIKPTVFISLSAEKLATIVNDWRVSQGFQPYSINDTLCIVASERLEQVKTDWSHNGFLETKNKYLPQAFTGENLSRNYFDEQSVLNSWLTSPTHRLNLDTNFKYSCIKCSGTFCVHEFADF